MDSAIKNHRLVSTVFHHMDKNPNTLLKISPMFHRKKKAIQLWNDIDGGGGGGGRLMTSPLMIMILTFLPHPDVGEVDGCHTNTHFALNNQQVDTDDSQA